MTMANGPRPNLSSRKSKRHDRRGLPHGERSRPRACGGIAGEEGRGGRMIRPRGNSGEGATLRPSLVSGGGDFFEITFLEFFGRARAFRGAGGYKKRDPAVIHSPGPWNQNLRCQPEIRPSKIPQHVARSGPRRRIRLFGTRRIYGFRPPALDERGGAPGRGIYGFVRQRRIESVPTRGFHGSGRWPHRVKNGTGRQYSSGRRRQVEARRPLSPTASVITHSLSPRSVR